MLWPDLLLLGSFRCELKLLWITDEVQDTTITTSSNITMTNIAFGAYAAMSLTASIYALPICEGIACKNI